MPYDSDLLLDRATAEERAGHWDAAAAALELLFRESILRGEIDPLLEALRRLGDLYRQAGKPELAEEYITLVLDIAGLHGSHIHAARALNVLAIMQQSRGDLAGAEATYLRALELSADSEDKRLLGNIEQNLGTLANIRGEHATALARYKTGLQHLEESGHLRACAYVCNNLGMLHVDLGRLDEAEDYFDRALSICTEFNDILSLGAVHLNRTELFLARGALDRARVICDEAFEIGSRVGDPTTKAEALKFYGIIYRETGKIHLAEAHLQQALRIAAQHDPLLEAETQRELALVLRAQDRNREALEALNRAHILFTQIRAEHDQADVNQRIAKLENDFLSLVRSWGESIEAKDRYTGGHCQRVADYACRIAEEVGITPGEMTWFRMGAFLHDVGKIEVPEEILNKPGRLTEEERALMERHTVIGDEILAPVGFPWEIRPMVRSHHERWDGRGYPDQLAAEAIPYTARILRIADIFDALTTARSYRQPLTPEAALRIMEEDEGSFDPEIFAVFRRLFAELSGQARQAHAMACEEAARMAIG